MTIQEIQMRRNRYTILEGTPPLTFENAGDLGVWGTGAPTVFDFTEESKTSKYAPFEFATINNASLEDLKILINGSFNRPKLVRKGTILTIKDFKGIRSLHIWKMTSTNVLSASQVEINVMKVPMTDDEYRRRQYKDSLGQKLRNWITAVKRGVI